MSIPEESSSALPDIADCLQRLAQECARQTYPAATLYVVATPIGNLCDISVRALQALAAMDAIACEDTRSSGQLLARYGIHTPLLAAHQHNEQEAAQKLLSRLQAGQRIALISDAGTPAVSDPGAKIVAAAHAAGIRVLPLPGACAAVSALSAAGMPDGAFYFAGFLPVKNNQRENALRALRHLSASLVFYEAPHRILETVQAIGQIFENEREIVLAREISKMFEEIWRGPLQNALEWLNARPEREKGEYVIVLQGATAEQDAALLEGQRVLQILLQHCSLKQAAQMAAEISGAKKNALYALGLELLDKK
ncbi:16S rRNA (cytidine(1402)-2'-O)-methyltransferase [Massilia sp. W12]|uniref:16S rRNA (cytidine(1402)-2'-O)-methyltransferase n=1 Tax=Massilia sp. W12 TaxID=3126507 RepID=UPI0030CF9619